MQVTTKLNDPFSYSILPIILIILLIILVIVIIIYINKPKKQKLTVITPPKKDVYSIKNKYLTLINNLLSKVNNNQITNRKAYQELSSTIRNFIYEMTGLAVQNCTLEDISHLNMPYLYELVSEYYDPEFARFSTKNVINSINKTKGVIEQWK